MLDNFRIIIADIPAHDDLVAEIYYKKIQWVQIYRKNGKLLVQFYGHPYEPHWEFLVEDAIQILEKAKNRLLEFEERKE